MDAQGQPARVGQVGIGREREREVGVGCQRAGIVAGDHAERDQLPPDGRDGGLELGLIGHRQVDR